MESVHIQPATLDDLEVIVPLFNAYRCFYGQPDDPDTARDFLQQRLEREESVILLARDRDDRRPVGFAQLYPSFSSVQARPAWILNDLYVDDQVRGLGLGRALVEEATRFARDSGAARISLETSRDNRRAQALYEVLGWREQTDMVHYVLELDDAGRRSMGEQA